MHIQDTEHISAPGKQSSAHIMMIRPVRFGFNAQTAKSNAFQHNDGSLGADEIQEHAQQEFDEMVALLRAKGIHVTVIEDTYEPHTPDSIFPNNWISFHGNGKVIIYPMESPNRQAEVRMDIPAHLVKQKGGEAQIIDLREHAQIGDYLEGTGSMIMDRVNQLVYACLSPRTNRSLFELFCEKLELEGILFDAVDDHGIPIYHTNVMMALGTNYVVICLDSIPESPEKNQLIKRLQSTGHEIIPISHDQMNAFAGNMLEVYNESGKRFLVMSKRAFDSLSSTQIEKLSSFAEPLVIPLDVIETYGGGSVRCMMAEVF